MSGINRRILVGMRWVFVLSFGLLGISSFNAVDSSLYPGVYFPSLRSPTLDSLCTLTSLMAPLLATLGVNNKVSFLEKAAGTSR